MSMMDYYNVSEKNRRKNKKIKNDFGVYSFFEKVLIKYVPLLVFDKEDNISNEEDIKAYESDQESFMALRQNYEFSKGIIAEELSSVDEMAHAFVWFMTEQIIVLRAGVFYINPNLLFKKLKEYNEYREYVEALNSTSVFSDGESKPEVQGIQYSKDSNSKK